MTRLQLLYVLLLPLGLGSIALAKSPPVQPYDIEIVLFERYGQGIGEHWPEEPGEPEIGMAVGNLSTGQFKPNDASRLSKSELQLGPYAYTLKRKGAKVHAHLGWRQAVRGRNTPNWYWIGSGRLQGLIRVSRGRYLHLNTDLLLQLPDSAQTYRIQLHRRMRSGEVHYVDHPKVGIVITANRFRAPEVEEEFAEEPATVVEDTPISPPEGNAPAAPETTPQTNN